MASYNISHEYLLSILDYNPNTGIFIWRERPLEHFKNKRSFKISNSNFSGKIAGWLNSKGYIKIEINSKAMSAHVLAYFYFYKKWPETDLDHIDRNKTNNSISNLRESNGQNSKNVGKRKDNKSGYKGVHFNKKSKKYISQIGLNNRRIHLGCFNTPEDAYAAYCKAAQEFHGEFACFD